MAILITRHKNSASGELIYLPIVDEDDDCFWVLPTKYSDLNFKNIVPILKTQNSLSRVIEVINE